jgi:GT2 family glycosyltransferase
MFAARYWPWLAFTRDVSAVTGACLAIRRELFLDMHGFDSEFPVNYNDADLCLRLRAAGYWNIYEPQAVLRHDECRTRTAGIRLEEQELWQKKWASSPPDPFYNPNLTHSGEDASLNL